MANVAKDGILFYSGADGYQNSRAQIQLSEFDGNTLAFIRFKDPGMLDAVRNETADIYYWTRASDH